MFKDYAAFVAFALFLTSCCGTTSSECTQQTACSCLLEDGYGYDLSNLTNLGLLNASNTQPGYTFYFQPCKNVKMFPTIDSDCQKGVSLCANKTTTSFLSLGTTEETKFVLEPGKLPSLILQHKDSTSKISLSCCDQCKTNLMVDSPPDGNQYHLTLVSPSACKVLLHSRGLSTGSVLVILFFVFSGLYFIGGGIVLTLTRGATGWERLPNHEFWCELPSLVRDGIVFTFNCFRMDSYERI